MSLFSFFEEAGSNFSQIKDSDLMMSRFSGVHRLNYSIDSYRLGMEYVQKFQDKIVRSGGERLTVAEFSILRLAFLATIAYGRDDPTSPHAPVVVPRETFMQLHIDAVERVLRDHENVIRRAVILEVL